MDRVLYTAMTGASHIMTQQATTTHNLANISTPGFRETVNAFRSVPIVGDGLKTRTLVVNSTIGSNFEAGSMTATGRDLDVAVQSAGWIAVQTPSGEAYTRNGAFQIDQNGLLSTHSGFSVLGDGGALTIPQDSVITIAHDGTISGVTIGGKSVESVGRIKLVNPPEKNLVRGDDGLFRLANGETASQDENVTVVQGQLESSNVNAVGAMTQMISQSRQFEMQMKIISVAQGNAQSAEQVITIS